MSARVAMPHPFLRLVALAALVAGGLLAGGAGAPLAARALPGPARVGALALAAEHAASGRCPAVPASPYERESVEGRGDTPAPGCDPVCLRVDALPRRPTRLFSPAAAPPFAALGLHRAHAGSESCSGTSLPPPAR